MTLKTTTVDTPVGHFAMVADADGVCVAGFHAEPAELIARLDARRRADDVVPVPDLGDWSDAVRAYFAGDVGALDAVPVNPPTTVFRAAACKAMRAVPAGETISYQELAAMAGNPQAIRAAGSACATNLVALIVPCHRIVARGGTLGGYYYGLDLKRRLLDHEAAATGRPTGRVSPHLPV